MPAVQVRECKSADEVFANYKAVKARMRALKPPEKPKPVIVEIVESAPEPEPIPVVVAAKIELPKRPYPQVIDIIRRVAKKYNVRVLDLMSDRRAAGFVFPRHIAFHMGCLLTPHSLPFLGRHFGGRDHTTIYHGHNKMARRRTEDKALDEELTALAAEIMGDCDAVG